MLKVCGAKRDLSGCNMPAGARRKGWQHCEGWDELAEAKGAKGHSSFEEELFFPIAFHKYALLHLCMCILKILVLFPMVFDVGPFLLKELSIFSLKLCK